MTTMLERAARAAAEKMRQQDQDAAIKSGCDIHLALDPYLEPARSVARAVLMAVREPDVSGVFNSDSHVPWWYGDAARRDFTDMIDAILEGK